MRSIKNFLLRLLVLVIAAGMFGTLVIMLINSRVKAATQDDIWFAAQNSRIEMSPVTSKRLADFGAQCAIVLGCGIEDNETPSPMLKDRLDLGIALYQGGYVGKILLSGDNGQEGHNEIHVMLKYTKDAGVCEEDIFCDHAGFSTYDSMYRAADIFKVEKAIVVTQKYHEYRALYIAKKLGIQVCGASSDQEKYLGQTYRQLREILARNKDFVKANIRAKATYGGDAIPISGSGIVSHGE